MSVGDLVMATDGPFIGMLGLVMDLPGSSFCTNAASLSVLSTLGSSRCAAEEPQSQRRRSTETPDRERRHAGSTCYATTEPQSRRRRPHGGACCEYKHIELASQSG